MQFNYLLSFLYFAALDFYKLILHVSIYLFHQTGSIDLCFFEDENIPIYAWDNVALGVLWSFPVG